MWIFCCGMKRSGSTLQYQLTAHLVEAAGLGQRVGWTRPEEFAHLKAAHEGDPGLKVCKVHNYGDALGAEFATGNARGVYIYRDLRDVAVSFMHKQNATFERLWQRDFLREPVAFYDAWTRQPGMLVSQYEVVMADPPQEVARIAAHLDIETGAAECAQIATEYTIDRQLERIGAAELADGPAGTRFDAHALLHTDHISVNQGQVQQWRDVLTSEQVQLIEARYGDWLVARGYPLLAELA